MEAERPIRRLLYLLEQELLVAMGTSQVYGLTHPGYCDPDEVD